MTAWDPLNGLRGASVYRRGRTFVVTSGRRAGYGPQFLNPPFIVLPADVADHELGETVNTAIEAYVVMDDLPSEEDIDEVGHGLYEVVGVRDGRAFDRGAQLVVVQEQGGRWSIQPRRRDHGGFFPFREDLFIALHGPAAEQIGASVKKAFKVVRGLA